MANQIKLGSNLYQINTRVWLKQFGSLPQVPIRYWQNLKSLQMDYIWLTGIWQIPEQGKVLAMSQPAIEEYKKVLPDFRPDDVDGSPFAIDSYTIDSRIGTLEEILNLRKTLHSLGLKLILDFIPNHFGYSSQLVIQKPDLFLQTNGKILNGKDPHFEPWVDTAQLDYSRQTTREFMQNQLLEIAKICDGVRCDMAMLVINSVFTSTWKIQIESKSEFWVETIKAIKLFNPTFVFVAECYWGLENELIKEGFDYAYNKTLLDALIQNNKTLVSSNLANFPLNKGVHFLENHDEQRSASIFELETLKTNAALLNSLPGLKLYFDGQLQGYKIRTPIQLNRSPIEKTNSEIEEFYYRLLRK